MNNKRNKISADLKRRVLIEAGHRCAIPTCRNITVDIHHIIPFEECKKHEYENLIALCPNCHRLAHKGEKDKKSLKIYKANLCYTHDKFTQFEVDMLFELYKLSEDEGILWPRYNMLLLKRLFDIGYIEKIENSKPFLIKGNLDWNEKVIELGPDRLKITKSGRDFINSLGIEK